MYINAVYVSWPFISDKTLSTLKKKYINCLCSELLQFANTHANQKIVLESLYIGGGQLETCSLKYLLDISSILKEIFYLNHVSEVTGQVGIKIVQLEYLHFYQRIGINRINIGIYQPYMSISEVNAVGSYFRNIALDICVQVDILNMLDWKKWFTDEISEAITQISIAFVGIEHKEINIDFYQWLQSFLKSRGFNQYETYGFARPHFQSIYMTNYLKGGAYKGFGLGAMSFTGTERFINESNLTKYMRAIENNQSPIAVTDTLQKYDLFLEQLMMGLRLRQGILIHQLARYLTDKQFSKFKQVLASLMEQDLVRVQDGFLALSERGLLYEHEILLKLSV